MAKPKRTEFQRESDLERIASLYLRGWRQADIAADIGLSRQQVSYDLKTIQTRWRTQTAINLDEAKQRELARIDELEREYWAAWEASKGERTKARQEKNVTGAVTKASMEKEQRDGNPAFLAGVMTCIDRRCKLLGLDAANKTEISGGLEITEAESIADRINSKLNSLAARIAAGGAASGTGAN